MEQMKPPEIVPMPYGRLFDKYEVFNAMQTALLNDVLNTDKSVVLSAPTGSGKTVAFELAIVRMLMETDRTPSTSNNEILPKAVYIAPIKALCSERFDDWRERFGALGINCAQLTGDTQVANLTAVRMAQIVVSTPEKWDSLTRRRCNEFSAIMPSIQLFIVDEVHLLNEDDRGPILEAIMARMKSNGVKRFVIASATIPNVEDLASWMRSCSTNVSQYVFNEMHRPVPLEKHVLGINSKLKGFQFDMKLNYQLADVIRKYSEGKATLIFCNSRKSAEMAASHLGKNNEIYKLNDQQKSHLSELAQRLTDTKLKKLVEIGIAYHHAGLQFADRALIESSFREGFLVLLFSTSTLAMGINLPAHLVIIKSTEAYIRGNYADYPENMLLQMIGRAGRPPYDTTGVVVILTQNTKVQKYKNLMNGKSPIESHLHKHLVEHLNSEIALNSICNLEAIMDWIRSTYLYVRSVRNPTYYGFPAKISKDLVERKLEELCFKNISALETIGLIRIKQLNGLNIQTTPLGKLMAKNYLSFQTMKTFCSIKGNENLQNIFDLIVQSKELSEFTLRVNEKKILNLLNKAPIRFPVKGRIKTNEGKISCIIQAVLGNLEITAPNLVQESLKMFRIAEHVSRSLLEYARLCVHNSISNGCEKNEWFQALLNVYIVVKCFHAKLWENSVYASKQLQGIGPIYSSLFFNAGKTTLKSIAQTDARTIEQILSKKPPFGDLVLQNLLTFPEYEIKLVRISEDFIEIRAEQINDNYVHKLGTNAVIIVGDSCNNLLLLAENFDEICKENSFFQRRVRIQDEKNVECIYGHIIHTSLVGVDAYDELEINVPKRKNTEKPNNKTKKQKKQLCAIKNDETMNDSDFLSVNTESSDNIDKNLKLFQFSKPKLRHHDDDERNDTFIDIMSDGEKNKMKIATIKPLKDASFMDDSSTVNTSKTTNTIQRKLTDYFSQRRRNIKLSTLSDISLNFTNITEGSDNFDFVKPIFNRFANSEKENKLSNASSDNTNRTNHSTESSDSIKVTCIQNKEFKEKISQKSVVFEAQSPFKLKSQIIQSNRTTTAAPYNSCPKTLTSFLGGMGNEASIASIVIKENIFLKNKQKRPRLLPIPSGALDVEIGKPKPPTTALKRPLKEIFINQNSFENGPKASKIISNEKQIASDKSCALTLSSFLTKKQPTQAKNLNNSNKNDAAHHRRPKPNENFNVIQSENMPKAKIPKMILKDNSKPEGNPPLNNKICDFFNFFGKNGDETIDEFIGTQNGETINLCDDYPATTDELSFWYTVTMNFQRLPVQAMSFENFRHVYNTVVSKEKSIQKHLEKHSKTSKSDQFKTEKNFNESKFKKFKNPKQNISKLTVENCDSISSQSLYRLQRYVDGQNTTTNTLRRVAINMINQNVMKRVLDEKSKINTANLYLEEPLSNVVRELLEEIGL